MARQKREKEKLLGQYEKIALEFLDSGDEKWLYQASLLSKRFVEMRLDPEEVVQMHFAHLESIMDRCDCTEHRKLTQRLSVLLTEVMTVYNLCSRPEQQARSELQ